MKLRFILVLVSIFLLASCSKLNMKNYSQLKTGMKYEEVISIIGSPESCSEKFGARSCIWGDSKRSYIKAKFLGETSVAFSHNDLK